MKIIYILIIQIVQFYTRLNSTHVFNLKFKWKNDAFAICEKYTVFISFTFFVYAYDANFQVFFPLWETLSRRTTLSLCLIVSLLSDRNLFLRVSGSMSQRLYLVFPFYSPYINVHFPAKKWVNWKFKRILAKNYVTLDKSDRWDFAGEIQKCLLSPRKRRNKL